MSSVRKIQLPDNTTVDINDSRVYVYRTVTGTAAVTETPFYCSRWDVTDETVTQYTDGMVVCLKVPVAGNGTYGTGFQINNLGYKPVVYNVNSMVSTRYGVGSVIWCVYNATQTASLYINSTAAVTVTGCWQVQDYDANTNTIGYQLRTNSSTRPVSSTTYRYRLMFSSLDNSKWVPATNSTSTNATSARTVNQEVINPWGRIVYYSTTTSRTEGQSLSATAQWDRYVFNLGYSFNTGTALDLTFPGPVYIKCTPQAGGGAIIDSTTPYTQALPSSADGKIYIYLGQAYSASEVELIDYHPVLYHDGSKIAMWTGAVAESNLFDCVMTYENSVWSCDHTWTEIYAAHQAGKLVRIIDGYTVYMPALITADRGVFSRCMHISANNFYESTIESFIYDESGTLPVSGWSEHAALFIPFTSSYKNKLDGIEAGAQVNVQSDWNQSDSTADDFIKNKPAIPSNIKGIGFVGSNGIYVSDDVRFHSIGESDYSSEFILVCGEAKTFQSGSAHYFYRLNGSSTNYYFGHAITINNGVYKAVLNDGTFSVTEIKNYQADWNAASGEAQILNKPTIPDAVSGVNDGTNWTSITIGTKTYSIPSGGATTLSALTDTTISSPTANQILMYDNTTSKWVNEDVPTEIFNCTLTYTYDSGTDTRTATCDKSISDIVAAFNAGKLVILKPAGDLIDTGETPENANVPYICTAAGSSVCVFVASDGSGADLFQFSALIPSDNIFKRSMVARNVILYSSGLSSTVGVDDGWHYKTSGLFRNKLTIQKNGTAVSSFTAGDGADETINITVPTSSNDLSDINVSSPSGGQILKYNSTSSKWENASETTELPSITGNANKILAVNNGATGVEWVTKPSSGLTNYDFTHTANTTVSGSTTTVTFAANTRGSAMLTISADLGLTIACNNGSDNYIWVKNTGSSEVDITISGVTKNSTNVSNVYVPSDGISVPAGGLCEIGVIVNTDGAFITSRNDLAL